MVTTAKSGKAGSVAGQGGGAEITEWSTSDVVEVLDATSVDSAGEDEFVEGTTNLSGSFTAIGSVITRETVAELILRVGQTVGDLEYKGKAIISNVAVTSPVKGGVATYTADFQMTGVVTRGAVV